jgi:hypothetical protein
VNNALKAPWPYFGAKSRIAPLVWSRLGNVRTYSEPFCGTSAVLLARPDDHCWWDQTENINDADGLLANAWRAIRYAPDEVAAAADWPVSECDLHARHLWLVGKRESLTDRLCGDPDWYDAKAAGWWIWGACSWIAGGWCAGDGPWVSREGVMVRADAGRGVNRQMPHLGTGRGVNRQMPDATTADGHCERWAEHLRAIFQRLSDRLRRVRVCCGDWSRICGPTPLFGCGTPSGVFFDPPYSADANRNMGCYAMDCGQVAHDVRAWCIEHGDDPRLRIAICGYIGEGHDVLVEHGWTCERWKAHGGYGSQGNGQGRENATREAVWFSPHCLRAGVQLSMEEMLA